MKLIFLAVVLLSILFNGEFAEAKKSSCK